MMNKKLIIIIVAAVLVVAAVVAIFIITNKPKEKPRYDIQISEIIDTQYPLQLLVHEQVVANDGAPSLGKSGSSDLQPDKVINLENINAGDSIYKSATLTINVSKVTDKSVKLLILNGQVEKGSEKLKKNSEFFVELGKNVELTETAVGLQRTLTIQYNGIS